MLTCQRTKHNYMPTIHSHTISYQKIATLNSAQSKVQIGSPQSWNFLWKFPTKGKVHRTQPSLKNSVVFWKLHSRFVEFINTFYAHDPTCIQMFTFSNFLQTHSCIHILNSDALMHSNVINSDWFPTHSNVLRSILNSSMSSRHIRKVPQASHLFTYIHGYHKTDPKRWQSHRIHECCINAISKHTSEH